MLKTGLGLFVIINLCLILLKVFFEYGLSVLFSESTMIITRLEVESSNMYSSTKQISDSTPVYPKSDYVIGIEFDMTTLKNICPGNGLEAPRSDNWPITWADDDNQYSSWGDGGGFGGTNEDGRVSMGVARIEGNKNNYSGFNVWGGKNPESLEQTFKGKSYGIISVDKTLYMLRSGNGKTEQCYGMQELHKSINHGRTWSPTGVDWDFSYDENNGFFAPTFLQFGKDYKNSRDNYIYIYAPEHTISIDSLSKWDVNKPGQITLIRVPKKSISKKSAYTYFTGINLKGEPTWSSKIDNRQPVFKDSENGVMRTSIIYNSGLKRYLLTVQQVGRYKDFRGKRAHIGIYESPEPWGPWSTVLFKDPWSIGSFPHLQNDTFLGDPKTVYWNFSPKWWSDNGKGFVMVYTGPGGDQWGTVEGCFTIKMSGK